MLSTPAYGPVLRWTAVIGLVVGLAGAVPSAMMAASGWSTPPVLMSLIAGALHLVSGYAVAVAYVALFALGSAQVRPPTGIVIGALVGAGQRSLTLYLLQSVIFIVILNPSVFGLGDKFGVALLAAIVAGVWFAGVLVAAVMDRFGIRGPSEVLLRELTYGSRRLSRGA